MEVNGDLNAVSSEALASSIAVAESSLARLIVVSIAGCSNCDSTALRVLVATKKRLEARFLVVVAKRSWLNRVFSDTGLAKRFSLCTSIDEALGKSLPIRSHEPHGRLRLGPYGAPPRRRRDVARAATIVQPTAYANILPMMRTMAAEGISLRDIAARLQADGHPTRLGDPWSAIAVCRVLARL